MLEPGEVQGVSRLCLRDARPGYGAAETREENLLVIARCTGQDADRPHRGQVENPCLLAPLGATRPTAGRQTIHAEHPRVALHRR